MATTVDAVVVLGTPGPAGTGITSAQWSALQAIIASDSTGAITAKDSTFVIKDDADATKQAKFQASGIATGTTRTYTLPDATTPLLGLADLPPFAVAQDSTDYTSTDTAAYANAATTTITLPAGTWTLVGIAFLVTTHSASGSERIAIVLDGTTITTGSIGMVDASIHTLVVVGTKTGVTSGVKTVTAQHRPMTAGTSTVTESSILVLAIRTA